MNKNKLIFALREAGQVRRTHTIQHHGTYNIAMHCFNALNLLFLLYPEAPSHNLIRAVLWHDVPERWTGDVPSPAKWASVELKDALDALEIKVLTALGLEEVFTNLTPDERAWLNGVDLLELFLWAVEQQNFGNKYAESIENKVDKVIEAKWKELPNEIKNFFQDLEFLLLPECDELLKKV